MSRGRGLRRAGLIALVLCAMGLLFGCQSKPVAAARVTVDGQVTEAASVSPELSNDLRVWITLDGDALIDLPFAEAHTVVIALADGGENTVEITGDAVYMSHANCDNQDCVNMGAVTRDNLELRVMGGFIICLPHRISVEVR